MKVKRWFFLSLLLALFCCRAAGPARPGAAWQPGPFLWEVEGPRGPLYLLGTIHVGVDAYTELPPAVWEKFSRAKTFVAEADPRELDPVALAALGMLPPEQSLSALLGAEDWARLTARLPAVPPERLDRFQPWLAFVALLEAAAPSPPEEPSMDLALLEAAREEKKQTGFLESMTEQALVLTEALDLAALKRSLEAGGAEQLKGQLTGMISAYRAGDAARYERLLEAQARLDPQSSEALRSARNREWLPALEGYAEQGEVFVAVGVGHLLGEEGLVALLQREGYKVTRLSGAPTRPEGAPSYSPPVRPLGPSCQALQAAVRRLCASPSKLAWEMCEDPSTRAILTADRELSDMNEERCREALQSFEELERLIGE